MGTATNIVFHMTETRSMPQHLLDSADDKKISLGKKWKF
jgi:hypothetical protein